jgi:hypothetical protein
VWVWGVKERGGGMSWAWQAAVLVGVWAAACSMQLPLDLCGHAAPSHKTAGSSMSAPSHPARSQLHTNCISSPEASFH